MLGCRKTFSLLCSLTGMKIPERGAFSELIMISWFVEVYNDLILFRFSLFVVFQIPLISFGNLGQLQLLMCTQYDNYFLYMVIDS